MEEIHKREVQGINLFLNNAFCVAYGSYLQVEVENRVTKKLLRCNGISFQDRKMYKVIVVINFKLKALFNMLDARFKFTSFSR